MKKNTFITKLYIFISAILLVASLALIGCGIYDYINEGDPIYILLCIAFALSAVLFAHLIYVFAKGKDFILFRWRLKLTFKICGIEKLDFYKKRWFLERYLNSREKLIRKTCPVCGKVIWSVNDKPCPRCKTKFTKDETEFTLARTGVSSHRLEALYEKDFRKLSGLIGKYDPSTDVNPTSGDGTDININITIR